MTEPHPITDALLAAIRHSPEPMVLTDPNLPDHPMIAVNAAFVSLTGYAIDQAVGRNCRFLQGPGTDPKVPRRIKRCLEERRGCIEWIVNYRRDGSAFWNLLFLSPVFDHDGRLLHYFGNQRDITAGQPADLPDYSLGGADMPIEAKRVFDALLPKILDESQTFGEGQAVGKSQAVGESQAAFAEQQVSERLMASVERLNQVTTRLVPSAPS